jgi:hypothetical protein
MNSKTGVHPEIGNGNMAHASISELYPDVGRIVLFVAFEVADSESEPNYQQIIFTADTEAMFKIDCSRDECAGGGFDFAPIVDEMMRNKESRVHGKRACEGSRGADGDRCLLKAEYRIIVD